MSEWTRTLLMAAALDVVSYILIKFGLLTFEGFVMFNLSILIAWLIRRTS